ncbi:MAG: MYXO-CTERM sorting domain-containing protein [Pseudomonadota bacterium]
MRNALMVSSLLGVLVMARGASATANFVYHERSSADVTGGAATSTCGGAVPYVDTLAPTSSDAVTLRFKVEFQNYTNQYRVAYTTDGSTPAAALGVGSGTTQVVSASFQCTYTPFADAIDIASATLPGQVHNTQVRYIVSAWHDQGGDEIFGNSGICGGCTPCMSSSCAEVFSYTVQDPSQDAGSTVDAAPAADSATAPDSAQASDAAIGQDLSSGSDAATAADSTLVQDSASPVDAASGLDAVQASDSSLGSDLAVGVDSSPGHDAGVGQDHAMPTDAAVAQDQASPADTATAQDHVMALDAAVADTTTALDVTGGADVGECTPGCQDPYYRILCSEGQRIVVPCSADTTCQDGLCRKPGAPPPQDEPGGCGCVAASAQVAWPLLALAGAIFARRRRRA